MKYSVKFDFNGHKFKMVVEANSVEQAEQACLTKIRSKVSFDAVDPVNDIPDFFKDLFNFS